MGDSSPIHPCGGGGALGLVVELRGPDQGNERRPCGASISWVLGLAAQYLPCL